MKKSSWVEIRSGLIKGEEEKKTQKLTKPTTNNKTTKGHAEAKGDDYSLLPISMF